jgi:hypothetical protein
MVNISYGMWENVEVLHQMYTGLVNEPVIEG